MRIRSIVYLLAVLLSPQAAFAADPPVVHVVVRNTGDGIVPGTFAALPKRIWRAGDTYLKVEEEPDRERHLHGVIIVHEPDAWFWNLYLDTARHAVDPGPGFVVHAPLFATRSDAVQALEIGRERAFFDSHHARRAADRNIDGVAVAVQELMIDGIAITLLTRKDNGKPFGLDAVDHGKTHGVRYDLYEEGLPFDPNLFALPPRVKIEEAEAAGSGGKN